MFDYSGILISEKKKWARSAAMFFLILVVLVFVALAIIGITNCAFADTLRFSWTPVQGVDGYEILEGNGSHVVFVARDHASDSATMEVNLDECKVYSIRSYKGTARSGLGNMIPVCPKQTIIQLPDSFRVQIDR